jgi:Prokaryotic N-terminal methylation motif
MRPLFLPSSSSRAALRGSAGFTLVELMVAMTGGLFLSIVVFALSRDASRFYQRESRVANATLAGVSGFERLSGDLARAGHLVTPNIDGDPHVCNRPVANWPQMLRRLRSVLIETNPAQVGGTELEDAGIKPQGIVIAGALNMAEVLTTAAVNENGEGGWQISLNTSTPAAARIGLSPANTATAANLAVLQSVFLASGNGRIVRLRKKGLDQYAVAAAVSAAPGPLTALALIDLASAPTLLRPKTDGVQCGIEGNGEDMDLSVIDLVRYNIRPMVADPAYAALFKASGVGTAGGPGALPYEGKRAELVRVELTPAGTEIDSTREIVGEYAVDLQLSGLRATSTIDPTLIPVTDEVNDTYASTQLLRGLHVRFSVRSREADRDRDIPTGSGGGSSDRYRIGLDSGKVDASKVFARVRTFQSDIPLRNLENSLW